MRPLIPTLSMQVTYQCNLQCRHCGPFCGPKERDWMTLEEMKDLIVQAAESGALSVVFTGGEPTLLGNDLPLLLRFIKEQTTIRSTRIVTNGWWAKTYDKARALLAEWKEAGLNELNISCGEYHQEFIPVENVANGYRAAVDLDYPTVLLAGEFLKEGHGRFKPDHFHRAIGERLLPPNLMSPFVTEAHGMSCAGVMKYGRGKLFLKDEWLDMIPEQNIPSICSDILSVITVHPNGNTTACCGIMVREESLLNIGNWREQRLREIVENASSDIILNWIRYVGLRDMKQWLKEKDPTLQFRDAYTSICDLCADIVYNGRAQKLLIAHGQERAADVLANKVDIDAALYEAEVFLYEPAGPVRG